MAIKCQHQQHDDPENQSKAKKTLLDEEKPEGSSVISANVDEKYELQHVKNDWFEKGKDQITLHVYIKETKKELLDVRICEDELNIQFSTSDAKFLNMYEGTTENTVFNWNVKLRGKVDVENSSFKFLKFMIEINLKKQVVERWGSLQKPNFPDMQSKSQSKEFKKVNGDSTKTKKTLSNGETNHNENVSPQMTTNSNGPLNVDVSGDEQKNNNTPLNGHANGSISSGQPLPPEPPPMPQVPTTNHKPGVVGGSSGVSLSEQIRNATRSSQNGSDSHVNNIDMDIPMELVVDAGSTGLDNLGNTCYLNSIIQCLANTRLLRDFFLSGEYKDDLNADNPLSFGGKLAVVFANLMKHMWSGKYRHVAPQQLKSLVGEKVCQFRGFMQQDAQEFMAFLLDGLHEDLNRIIKKPYTEEVEGAGRPDHVVAEEAWQRYKSRNDSIVVDLFQGQLKSKLTCPVCKKISIKFDPFMNLSVPLPKEQKLLNVVFFFKDPTRTPMKLAIKISQDANLEQLTSAVEKKIGVRESNMRVIEEFQGKFHKFFEKGSSLSSAVATDNIYIFEVLSVQEAGEEVYEVPIIQRLLYPLSIPLHCADCYKNQDPTCPLRRCVGCFAIGYCNRLCQERHWPMHKKHCKRGGKHTIGKPFIVSMPASQATFTRLKDLAEEYAKHSVEVRDGEPSKDETWTSPEKDQTATDESQESMPRFFFKPINIYGEPVMGPEGTRLSDQGDQTLDLSNKVLGLDWRNNPKARDWVTIKNKTLECEEHPSYRNEERSASYSCSLRECLDLYTEPETLGKDDAWYCPKCKLHREATKQLSVWRLPEILIIHLKRFSFRNILYRDKITKLVDFPISGLDMSDYTVSKVRSPDNIYDLFAVSNHMGSVNFGHYTAYGRIPDPNETTEDDIGWRYFDDRTVSQAIEDRVVSKCAYVLFYQRRKNFKTAVKPSLPNSLPTASYSSCPSTSREEKDERITTEGREEQRRHETISKTNSVNGQSKEHETSNDEKSCTTELDNGHLQPENERETLSNGNGVSDNEESHKNVYNGHSPTKLDNSEVDECELD